MSETACVNLSLRRSNRHLCWEREPGRTAFRCDADLPCSWRHAVGRTPSSTHDLDDVDRDVLDVGYLDAHGRSGDDGGDRRPRRRARRRRRTTRRDSSTTAKPPPTERPRARHVHGSRRGPGAAADDLDPGAVRDRADRRLGRRPVTPGRPADAQAVPAVGPCARPRVRAACRAQRVGQYALDVDGARRAALLIGGQPGP